MSSKRVKPNLGLPPLTRSTDQDAMKVKLGLDASPANSAPVVALKPAAPLGDSQELVIGRTYELPLYRFQRSDNNARHFYRSSEVDSTGTSLKSNGQDVPAVGYVGPNGRICLTDGQKRFQAATHHGVETLRVEITAPPEDELTEYEKSRRINKERSDGSALDDAVKWQGLLAKGAYKTQKDISDRLQISPGQVSKVLNINKIPERLLANMAEHDATRAASHAYLISTIFDDEAMKLDPEKAELIASDVIDATVKSDLSRPQLEALIKSKLTSPQRRERAETLPVKYGEYKGDLKVFPSRGDISLSFSKLPPEKVVHLKERIEKMLHEELGT